MQVVAETWTRTGGQVTDYTLYTGALGTALLLFKSFQVTGDRRDLALAGDIVRACDAASTGLPQVSCLPFALLLVRLFWSMLN
jgi:hypothetical protein